MTTQRTLDDMRSLELTPRNIDQLERALTVNRPCGGPMGMKDFVIAAEHLVGASLAQLWMKEGTATPTAIIAKMREEVAKRQKAIARVNGGRRSGGSLAEVVPDRDIGAEDDIPF